MCIQLYTLMLTLDHPISRSYHSTYLLQGTYNTDPNPIMPSSQNRRDIDADISDREETSPPTETQVGQTTHTPSAKALGKRREVATGSGTETGSSKAQSPALPSRQYHPISQYGTSTPESGDTPYPQELDDDDFAYVVDPSQPTPNGSQPGSTLYVNDKGSLMLFLRPPIRGDWRPVQLHSDTDRKSESSLTEHESHDEQGHRSPGTEAAVEDEEEWEDCSDDDGHTPGGGEESKTEFTTKRGKRSRRIEEWMEGQ